MKIHGEAPTRKKQLLLFGWWVKKAIHEVPSQYAPLVHDWQQWSGSSKVPYLLASQEDSLSFFWELEERAANEYPKGCNGNHQNTGLGISWIFGDLVSSSTCLLMSFEIRKALENTNGVWCVSLPSLWSRLGSARPRNIRTGFLHSPEEYTWQKCWRLLKCFQHSRVNYKLKSCQPRSVHIAISAYAKCPKLDFKKQELRSSVRWRWSFVPIRCCLLRILKMEASMKR